MKKTLLVISLVVALSGCVTDQGTVSGYRWVGDPLKMPQGDNPAAVAASQCQWEARQATVGRQQPAYSAGGYNNSQFGNAAAGLAAAMAAAGPGPGMIDECMAAKGWRLEYRR